MPTNITLNSPSISFSWLGQTQQLVPTVTDQDGQTVSGATVTWTSNNNSVATVSPSGLVTAVGGGSATVIATSGAAITSSDVTVNQTPTQLQKISGDGQTAPAGATLTNPLVVQVNDAGGSAIPGRTVTFTVTQGEGTTAAATVITGNDGRASTSFTTGTIAGSPQQLSVTVATLSVTFTATAAADHSAFNIGLRYLSTATTAQQQAFTNARLKWESVVSADLADVALQSNAEVDCGPGTPAVNQTVDDVLILVRLVAIDGPGNILGGAGPCFVREPGDPLTVMGVMQFDTDDLEELESGGFLGDVILHEMGHVLGIGTLWNVPGLPVFLADPSLPSNPTADPHFIGSQAIAAFDNAGGVAYTGGKVPVDNSLDDNGNPIVGTADSHWRESVLDNELMTGFIGAGQNPLSRISIASLADQGYPVNIAAADPYSVILSSLRAFDSRRKLQLKNDILRLPIRKVDRRGRVTGELRR